jgi:hypothetical protein
MEGYVSPNENLSSVVDTGGNIHLVERGAKLPAGIMKIDDYVSAMKKGKVGKAVPISKGTAPKRTRADIQAEMDAIDKQLED